MMRALLLSLCALLGVPSTPARTKILAAIASATTDAHEAALLVVFAKYESDFSLHPEPLSWDARADVAHGTWQLWGAHGFDSVATQAKAWIWLYHAGQRSCDVPLAPICGGCRSKSARRIAVAREAEAARLEREATR